jgi:hypothetical protein
MEDSNIRIPIAAFYRESENIYRNQEDINKKEEDRFPFRVKGSSVLDQLALELKFDIPNDVSLINKNFTLHFEDSVSRLYSDYPRSSSPVYEKQAHFSADLPIHFIEK